MKNIQSKLAITLALSFTAYSGVSMAGEMPQLDTVTPLSHDHVLVHMTMPVLEVQGELKMPTLDDNSYNGRPVGQPQPRPRGNKPTKQTLPSDLGVDAYNGRPVGQPQPRPRGSYVVPVAMNADMLPIDVTLPDVSGVFGYNGRPAGQPQPTPRGGYILPDDMSTAAFNTKPVMPIQPAL